MFKLFTSWQVDFKILFSFMRDEKTFVFLISLCRLQEVLKEYDEVISGIPENVLPLMKPFTNRVDETVKPGLTMLNWTSLNVYTCK